MAEKQDGNKPNPFGFPVPNTAPSLVFGKTAPKAESSWPPGIVTVSKSYVMSGSNSPSKNLFLKPSMGTSSSASMSSSTFTSMSSSMGQPVPSLQSNMFGGSGFKGINSGGTSSVSSSSFIKTTESFSMAGNAFGASSYRNPTSGLFETSSSSNIKSGVNAFPVFGGQKTQASTFGDIPKSVPAVFSESEKSMPTVFRETPKSFSNPFHEITETSSFPFKEKSAGTVGTFASSTASVGKTEIDKTKTVNVLSTSGSSDIFRESQKETGVSSKTGVLDSKGILKASTVTPVFGGTSSNDPKVPSLNAPTLFGGTSTTNNESQKETDLFSKPGAVDSKGILKASTVTPVFGGTSSNESKISHAPTMFGGTSSTNNEKLSGSFGANSNTSNTFVKSSLKSSECEINKVPPTKSFVVPVFGDKSSTSSASNLFGGISNKAISSTASNVKSDSTVTSTASTMFGGTKNESKVPSSVIPVFGGSSNNTATSTPTISTVTSNEILTTTCVSSITPTIFGGTKDAAPASISLAPTLFGGTKEPVKTSVSLVFGSAVPKTMSSSSVSATSSVSSSVAHVFGDPPESTTVSSSPLPKNFYGIPSEKEKNNENIKKSEPTTANVFEEVSEEELEEGEIDERETEVKPEKNDLVFGKPKSEISQPAQSKLFTGGAIFGGTSTKPTARSLFGGNPEFQKTKSNFDDTEEKGEGPSSQIDIDEKVEEVSEDDIEKEKKRKKMQDLEEILGLGENKSSASSSGGSSDKKDITKIIVAQIPDKCMDKDIIRSHFQKFGHIKRIFINSKSNQATVQYEDHKGASRAKRKGHKIHPILPEVKIFYAAPVRRKSEEYTNEATLSKKKAIKTLQQSHSPTDIDPYTPLDRPSKDSQNVFASPDPIKFSRRDLAIKNLRTPTSENKRFLTPSKMFGASPSTPKSSSKMSPRLIPRSVSSKLGKTRSSLSKISEIKSPFSTPSLKRSSSPKLTPRSASPNLVRVDSPKPVSLRMEDKLLTSRSLSPSRDNSVINESKRLVDSQAFGSGDRYNVLKARDKLLRIEKKQQALVTSLSAACPDMCPELERYMRDVQNDLSSFEITNGILDHKLVVKKFSRSSADKEEPLPHELRPGPVLLNTMNFLVANIITLPDEKDIDIGIWYNYLWDRTRAIRNDISQQQLTDSTAVTILERCVRFHIYAAVYLCEENPDVFDRKLNTENLTKSLQSLKELYKDLAEMHVYFPSEAEFRSYEMLLHLNDGEKFIYQYSQYRKEIRKSPDVKYAHKVFLALKSNNYVKFFRLIKSGTYLQGCILHRYFQQVRTKALDVYLKAYSGAKKVCIPHNVMISTLGFENLADAQNYLQYHSIKIIEEFVVLDKRLVDLTPEGGPPPMKRPQKLIESNRLFSVAEVIQGGPVPSNPLDTYVPHDSFDSEGYLKPDARDASDQTKKFQSILSSVENQNVEIIEPTADKDEEVDVFDIEDEPVPPCSPEKYPEKTVEQKSLSDREFMSFVKQIYDDITYSVISPIASDIAQESIKIIDQELMEKRAVESIRNRILSDCVEREIRHISKEAYKKIEIEVKEKEKEQEREERRKHRAMQKERERQLKALKEAEEKKRKAKLELYEKITVSLNEDYYNEFLYNFVLQLSEEAFKEVEKEIRKTAVEELCSEIPKKLLSEVVNEELEKVGDEVISLLTAELEMKINTLQQKINRRKMHDYFHKWRNITLRARRRKQARTTFPASCSQLTLQEQNEVFSWGYARKSSENISAENLLKIEKEYSELSRKISIINQLRESITWYPLPIQEEIKKIAQSALQQRPFNLINHYFKLILCLDTSVDSTVLLWLRSKLCGVENGDISKPLDTIYSSISNFSGLEVGCSIKEVPLTSLKHEETRGTCAILFITEKLDNEAAMNTTVQKLQSAHPDVPFQIISERKSCLKSVWGLEEDDIHDSETSKQLLNTVLKLWHQHSSRIHVASSHFKDFVTDCVVSNYLNPSILKQQERKTDGNSPFSPSTYINLYNKVISHLEDVIKDEKLNKLDWPPPELSGLKQVPPSDWKSSNIHQMMNILDTMKLSSIDLEGFVSWKLTLNVFYKYVERISHPESFSLVLWSNVHSILSQTAKLLKDIYGLDVENPDVELHALQLPWTELIYAFVSHKLNYLTNVPVFYQPKRLKNFIMPYDWWIACDALHPEWKDILETGPVRSNKRKAKPDYEEDVSEEPQKIPKLSCELIDEFVKEKEKYLEFEKRLRSIVEDTDTDIWNEMADESEEVSSKQLNVSKNNSLCYGEDLEGAVGGILESGDIVLDVSIEKKKQEEFLKKLERMLEPEY